MQERDRLMKSRRCDERRWTKELVMAVETEAEWGPRTESWDDEEEGIFVAVLISKCHYSNIVVVYIAQKSGTN